jgi:agmatine deiminase
MSEKCEIPLAKAGILATLLAIGLLVSIPRLSATADESGYRMIGEWAPMQSIWIQWPDHRDPTLYGFDPSDPRFDAEKGSYLAPEQWVPVYVELAREFGTEGRVDIIVLDAEGEKKAREALAEGKVPLDNLVFNQLLYDHPWSRDNLGPFCMRDGKLHILDFGFNAWEVPEWGPWERDDVTPQQVADRLGIGITHVSYVDPTDGKTKPLIFEGGAFEYSGEGTVVASWANMSDRNPNLDQAQATRIMKEITGAHTLIWIEHYVEGSLNHTDGFMKFYAPGKVAVAPPSIRGRERPHSAEAIKKLEAAGWTVTIADVSMNHVVYGSKVLCGFTGYEFFDPPGKVQRYYRELKKLYPDKEVVLLDTSILALNGGGIHCVTQQQPVVPSR